MSDLKEFWEGVHSRAEVLYLANSGVRTLGMLGLPDTYLCDKPVRSLLNIGVGFGSFERWARHQVDSLCALDIAETAQKVVEGVVDTFFTSPQQLPADSYDLITEVLVAQHVADEILCEHFLYGIRALREDGLFAIQIPAFLEEPTNEEKNVMFTEAYLQSGSVKRSIGDVVKLIRANGGKVLKIVWHSDYPQYNMSWYGYHITKATA